MTSPQVAEETSAILGHIPGPWPKPLVDSVASSFLHNDVPVRLAALVCSETAQSLRDDVDSR